MLEPIIDFDHAATTQMREEVLESMLPFFRGYYGNAGSTHKLGVASNKALNQARRKIANLLDTNNDSIYFTSGATEANNWAIRGTAYGYADKGKHLIVSSIEHPSILNACRQLSKEGFEISYLSVNQSGQIKLEELERLIRKDTILVSVMTANNETGILQPIREIGNICRKNQVLFHTDAVQAFGKIPISVKDMKIDLLTLSGHKLYGPKGIGSLYVRDYLEISPLIMGGEQQSGFRAGTEPIPEIVGMAKACELAVASMEKENAKVEELRLYLKNNLKEKFQNIVFHENETCRIPHILNVSVLGYEAEQIQNYMDTKGIMISGGSACASRSRKPSFVLTAMGKSPLEMKSSLRISLGRENTLSQCQFFIEELKEFIRRNA